MDVFLNKASFRDDGAALRFSAEDVLIMVGRDPVIDEIKNLIDLHDLISETCKLYETNRGEWRGAHKNKHGSKSGNCLYVTQDWWWCHHCNAGGDVYNWIADRDDLNIMKDFPEILHRAAGYADVEPPETNTKSEIERRAISEVLKAAAVHFHDNLTDKHRARITSKWGIKDETIDNLLIGIARNDDALEVYLKGQNFSQDQMLKSGLFFDWGERLQPHFMGRFVFPYWKRGTVRYMIARQTDHTPKNKWEQAKYKKLLTHNEKHPYVSEYVNNNTFYGEDSLNGAHDWCLITEGVTDCIMAIQTGLPCISPVTTKFRKTDHKKILKLVERFETVYICNDAEDNEAGLEGATKTAEFLESHGVTTKLITLPRTEGVEKVDLAEYLRDNGVDAFRALFGTSQTVWNVKLSRQPVTDDAGENAKNAETFISEELSQMDAVERVAFIESDVKAHFGLSDGVIRELIKTPVIAVNAEKYFDGKRFVSKRLADEIMNRYTFKTMSDTEEVYVYHAGVYVCEGKERIESEAQRILGEKSSTYNVNEVVNYIKRATYVKRDEFDTDKDIINLANGLFNIKTMQLQPHDAKHLSLQKSPIKYNPDTRCDRIKQFFKEVLRDVDVVFMFELFGYALLKRKRMDIAVIFEGRGRNGKSVMIMLLVEFVGEDMCSHVTPTEMSGDDKFATADMFGKLVNSVDDLGDTPLRNLGVFKSVVSGKKIRAQHKMKKAFNYKPNVICVFACNDVPPTADTSDAFFSRMPIVPFLQTFYGENDNENLIDELITPNELSGLFNIAIKAVTRVLDRGSFSVVTTIEEKRKMYTCASNPIARFVDDIGDLSDPDAVTPKDEVYGVYMMWSQDNGKRVENMGKLTQYLEILGVTIARPTIDGDRVRCYKGIQLRSKTW